MKFLNFFVSAKNLILEHYLKTIKYLENRIIRYGFGTIFLLIVHSFVYPPDIFKEIENAISLGNAKMIENYLGQSIELETPSSKGIYSKSQAEVIIDKFFQKYPPVSFTIYQKGNSYGGSRFAVGNYMSSRERSFRVTIFIKKNGQDYLIQEIKFE